MTNIPRFTLEEFQSVDFQKQFKTENNCYSCHRLAYWVVELEKLDKNSNEFKVFLFLARLLDYETFRLERLKEEHKTASQDFDLTHFKDGNRNKVLKRMVDDIDNMKNNLAVMLDVLMKDDGKLNIDDHFLRGYFAKLFFECKKDIPSEKTNEKNFGLNMAMESINAFVHVIEIYLDGCPTKWDKKYFYISDEIIPQAFELAKHIKSAPGNKIKEIQELFLKILVHVENDDKQYFRFVGCAPKLDLGNEEISRIVETSKLKLENNANHNDHDLDKWWHIIGKMYDCDIQSEEYNSYVFNGLKTRQAGCAAADDLKKYFIYNDILTEGQKLKSPNQEIKDFLIEIEKKLHSLNPQKYMTPLKIDQDEIDNYMNKKSEIDDKVQNYFNSLTNLDESICHLAMYFESSISPTQLTTSSVMANGIHTVVFNEVGQKTGDSKSNSNFDPIDGRNIERNTYSTTIAKATSVINEKFEVKEEALKSLLIGSKFVPDNRIKIFSRGIMAFIQGDIMVASHLLTAQMENSFRYLLGQHGLQIRHRDRRSGRDQEISLNKMLEDKEENQYRKKLEEIFSEDIINEATNLFESTDTGPNFRNHFGHGLLSDDSCSDSVANYACWYILYLCLYFYVIEFERN